MVLALPPIYSEQYAKVRYQPGDNRDKAELNLEQRDREEVTEKLQSHSSSDKFAAVETFEVATEPESEQINIARFIHTNIPRDKIVEERLEETTTEIELVEEFLPTQINIESASKKSNDEDKVISEYSQRSEIEDLNHQGPYYIYHPNKFFQKTVFNMEEYLHQLKLTPELNFVPIYESVFTYDPNTFVFQRLHIR